MSQWKKIASFTALSASMAFAATGCLAQDGDETTDEQEITAVTAEETTPETAGTQGEENIGEADQAIFGFGLHRRFPFFGFPFFGGFGGLGCGLGGFGCGLGGFGCGLGGFGGCGLGGFGLGLGCGLGGFGWPFFGGCGC